MISALLLVSAGCKSGPPKEPTAEQPKAEPIITTPVSTPVGRVAHVNTRLRYVVIEFTPGNVPEREQRMNIYRENMKVGEVNITGPTRGANTAGDITSGDAAEGDSVRVE